MSFVAFGPIFYIVGYVRSVGTNCPTVCRAADPFFNGEVLVVSIGGRDWIPPFLPFPFLSSLIPCTTRRRLDQRLEGKDFDARHMCYHVIGHLPTRRLSSRWWRGLIKGGEAQNIDKLWNAYYCCSIRRSLSYCAFSREGKTSNNGVFDRQDFAPIELHTYITSEHADNI
jgi:hypothetical protein